MASRMPLALLVAAVLPACRTDVVPEGAVQGVNVPHPAAQMKLDNVGFLDPGFVHKIAVERQGTRRTDTGTLEVWILLRNRTDYPHQVEGRTQFFDADTVPVEGPSAWKRVMLPPNGTQTYRELSTRAGDVAHYYVEMREGR